METSEAKTFEGEKVVHLEDTEEILYWTERFHCSETELLEAIDAVGNNVIDIDDYLGSW